MNLFTFLEEVEKRTDGLNRDELKQCLHEVARKLPGNQRLWFIDLLDEFSKEDKKSQADVFKSAGEDLLKERDELVENLSDINREKYYISEEFDENFFDSGSFYYEYEDWEDPRYYFSPDELITETIERNIVLNGFANGKSGLCLRLFVNGKTWIPALYSF